MKQVRFVAPTLLNEDLRALERRITNVDGVSQPIEWSAVGNEILSQTFEVSQSELERVQISLLNPSQIKVLGPVQPDPSPDPQPNMDPSDGSADSGSSGSSSGDSSDGLSGSVNMGGGPPGGPASDPSGSDSSGGSSGGSSSSGSTLQGLDLDRQTMMLLAAAVVGIALLGGGQ